MNLHKVFIIFFILLNTFSAANSFGYRARTHRSINNNVIMQKFGTGPLKVYFQDKLGYSSIATTVNGLRILQWFENAGAQEDEPPFRTPNHFLDPLANKGFTATFCGGIFSGLPTAVWAQTAAGKQSIWGSYSWQDSRKHFYQSLTSNSNTIREQNLADSFRALGQVMHLVADMSVPEHTRNTSHIIDNTIEPWLEKVLDPEPDPEKKSRESRFNPDFYYAVTHPFNPDSTLLQQLGKFPGAQIPIANLYDFELFRDGSSPGVTVTQPVGLAEYTNANFFSFNTIFQNYVHPAWSSMELHEDIDDESGKLMTFICRKDDAAGEHVKHLAQANVFSKHLEVVKTNGFTLENDKVYKDYMEKLIPRAAGYAGALVDYFYRGTIEVQLIEEGVTFRSVRIKAKNTSPNGEKMGPGEAALVIRYKTLKETPLGGYGFLLNTPSEEYSYKVVKLQNVTIPRDAPVELTFDFSTDTLPLNFDDLSLQLVYKGTLGNEDCAVAASNIQALNGIHTDFDLTLPSSGIYAKTSDGSLNATFNELRLTALTATQGGLSIPNSRIELALEYRVARENPFQSIPVEFDPLDGMSYIIRVSEKNGVKALPQGVPVELVFDISSIPLSVFATDVYANVVIAGTDSEGNPKTFAVGFKDISEPTPIDFFNNTDYVCVGSQWYPAGSPEAIAEADRLGNKNGFDDETDTYHHNFTNIYAKISSAANPVKASANDYDFLEPGPVTPSTLKRMGFILTDNSFTFSFLPNWVHVDYPTDGWTRTEAATLDNGLGFKNQADPDGNYVNSGMHNIRGNLMCGGGGVVYNNVKYPAGSTCDWASLPPTQ